MGPSRTDRMIALPSSYNVFETGADPFIPTGEDLAVLKAAALASPLRRARVRFHKSDDDRIHEMLIVLAAGTYIRPHRHIGKTETFHLIEGEASVVFFEDEGGVSRHVRLSRDGPSLYHLRSPLFHTQLVLSEFVVFHEITDGPFRREDSSFAPWAPAEPGPAATAYLESLREIIDSAARSGGRRI